MKILHHTWIKSAQLEQMQLELARKEEQVSAAQEFVKAITQGNLEVSYKANIDQTIENGLSTSLANMRDQMKKISAEEKQRHWVTEGLAKFGEILRGKNNNLDALSDTIISSLVKYLNANQGALYLINEDNPNDAFVELIACFAYDRKKYLNQRIEIGQGLIGQAVLEKDTVYMTSVPANYVKITSGLGEALPRNLLIVPLKLEEKIFGFVELASFEIIQRFQIEFVERLGQSIASTIATVKVNEKTKLLLQETQTQAEQMRAQEEEMRQSMEELNATQEEMQRILKEVQAQERYMNELIDSSNDSILVLDTSYKVLSSNKMLKQSYSGIGIEVMKGLDIRNLFSESDWPKYKAFYDRAFAGETFQATELYQSHGFDSYFMVQYTPMRNPEGNVIATAVFAKDVSELMKAQKVAEQLASDQQQKNEQLTAQEEELRQNMEELSSTQEEMQRIILEVQSKEKYLNDIINVTSDVIFTVDKEHKIVSFNSAMEAGMLKMGVAVKKGFCLLDIFPESERQAQKAYYDRAFGGESFERTEHFQHNGLDVYSIVNHAPLRNEKGEIYAVVVFSKDVSEMYHTLKEVKQKERELNEIINASTDSIWTVDLDCKLVAFNRKFIDVFAARQVRVAKGMDMIEVLQEHEQQTQVEMYARVFCGESFELTQTFAFGGTDVHILITYSPIKDDQGEVVGAALYAKDISAIVIAQQQAENLVKESQRQNEILRGQEEKFRQNLKELEMARQKIAWLERRKELLEQSTLFAEVDCNGKIVDCNKTLIKVTGYDRKELIGRPYSILSDTPEQLSEACIKNLALGKVWKGIITNVKRNAEQYWMEATFAPTLNSDGKVEKIIITGYPIIHSELGAELYHKQSVELGWPLATINGGHSLGRKLSVQKKNVRKLQTASNGFA